MPRVMGMVSPDRTGPFPNHMNRAQITEKMKELLTKQPHLNADVTAVNESTKLDEIGFDSISILDFMYDVEAQFGIETEVADLVKFETVKDMLDYLQSKLSA